MVSTRVLISRFVRFGAAFRISGGSIWEKEPGQFSQARAMTALKTAHITTPSSMVLGQFIFSASYLSSEDSVSASMSANSCGLRVASPPWPGPGIFWNVQSGKLSFMYRISHLRAFSSFSANQ